MSITVIYPIHVTSVGSFIAMAIRFSVRAAGFIATAIISTVYHFIIAPLFRVGLLPLILASFLRLTSGSWSALPLWLPFLPANWLASSPWDSLICFVSVSSSASESFYYVSGQLASVSNNWHELSSTFLRTVERTTKVFYCGFIRKHGILTAGEGQCKETCWLNQNPWSTINSLILLCYVFHYCSQWAIIMTIIG